MSSPLPLILLDLFPFDCSHFSAARTVWCPPPYSCLLPPSPSLFSAAWRFPFYTLYVWSLEGERAEVPKKGACCMCRAGVSNRIKVSHAAHFLLRTKIGAEGPWVSPSSSASYSLSRRRTPAVSRFETDRNTDMYMRRPRPREGGERRSLHFKVSPTPYLPSSAPFLFIA